MRRALRVLFHPTEEKNPNERVPGGAKVKKQMEFTDDLNESEDILDWARGKMKEGACKDE